MNLSLLWSYAHAILRELSARKLICILGGASISLLILIIGTQYKASYETSMLIYADNQSILRPLLASQAEVTRVQEHTRVVREKMLSAQLLRATVKQVLPNLTDELEIEQRIKELRGNIRIIGLGDGHIRIGIAHQSRDFAYDSLNVMTELFIKDSSDTQKSESRSAFEFIDNQVTKYKNQLVEAEENLKSFRAGRMEGSVEEIARRISQLQSTIESMRLDVEDAKTRVATLKKQLEIESRLTSKTYKADIYRQRLAELVSKRDSLLLQYHESYPDVVSLNLQIDDMRNAIVEAESNDKHETNQAVSEIYSPLYQQLRSELSTAEVKLQSLNKRLASNEVLLEKELERRTTIAAGEAELSELNRDYSVIKNIYEDMLERKEKARLSMTLSAEGQGVSYKIVEPPEYPIYPKGARFVHFLLLSIFLGGAIPIGAIIAYILVDPRIRFMHQIESAVSVPVLAVVPKVSYSLSARLVRKDTLISIVAFLIFSALYLTIVIGYREGWFEQISVVGLGGL